MDVLYICNRKRCERCDPFCEHTLDVRFAENFELKETDSKTANGEYIMYAVEKARDSDGT